MTSSYEPVSAWRTCVQLIFLMSVLSCWRHTYSSVKLAAVCLEAIRPCTHTHTHLRPLLQDHIVLSLVTWGTESEGGQGMKGSDTHWTKFSQRRNWSKCRNHLIGQNQWEEPKNRSLSECNSANFNKNTNDIHDFYGIWRSTEGKLTKLVCLNDTIFISSE